MADLRGLFDELGFGDVSTHLQSGNVLFEGKGSARQLETKLERAIGERLAPGVSVLLRTKAQLARVVTGNPFASREISTSPRCLDSQRHSAPSRLATS